MKEKIKSLLLAFLVIMSMYLSYILWISFPETSAFMKKSTTLEVDLFHIIRPEYIIVNFGGTYHTLVEDKDLSAKIWNEVINFLKSFKVNKIEAIDKNAWDQSDEKLSAHLFFGKGINSGLFSDIFTGKDSFLKKLNSNVYLDEIIADADDNVLFIKDNINKKYYKMYYTYRQNSLKNLINSLKKTDIPVFKSVYENDLDSYFDENVFLPFRTDQMLLKKLYNKDSFSSSQYRRIVERLFINQSIVREITENSGSLVYTDGLRSLRIYKNGYVEFYNTVSEQVTADEITSLKNVITFLNDMGIQPERIYLCGIDEDNSQYTFYFNYITDFPIRILKNNKGTVPITVNILGGAVKSATIQYLNPLKGETYNKPIISVDDVIGIATEKIRVYGKIEDLKMIYLYDRGYFIPAYSLTYKNRQYYLNAFDGQLINDGV